MAGEKGNKNSQLILEAIFQAVFTAITGLQQGREAPALQRLELFF